jgi:hypothetical protein
MASIIANFQKFAIMLSLTPRTGMAAATSGRGTPDDREGSATRVARQNIPELNNFGMFAGAPAPHRWYH